jgi:hypothetical protein
MWRPASKSTVEADTYLRPQERSRFFGWGSLLILHGNMVYDGLKKIGEGIEVRRYSMGYADRQEY